MVSIQSLLSQRLELDRAIAAARAAERQGVIAQIREIMRMHELTVGDIAGRKGARSKVAPKFIDPSTGQTWSGRGLHPKWLREALAKGAKLSQFAIDQSK